MPSFRFVLFVVLASILGAVVAQQEAALPAGPAPRFFTVTVLDDLVVELQEVGVAEDGLVPITTYRASLDELDVRTASGLALPPSEARTRLAPGDIVLVAADAGPVDPAYLTVLEPSALILHGVVVREQVE